MLGIHTPLWEMFLKSSTEGVWNSGGIAQCSKGNSSEVNESYQKRGLSKEKIQNKIFNQLILRFGKLQNLFYQCKKNKSFNSLFINVKCMSF